MMIYRREIDGLRAIAVIPVIFFHAGIEKFSGGYVGVDIFFVISGYLITSIIISDLEAGRFSIGQFYERRARRILPALFFVLILCIPFAYIFMNPNELEDFSKSLISVVLFSSNILFWREAGYFASAAELKPLLHTWSLAVEEQYYMLFPVFISYFWRFDRDRVFWAVCIMAIGSLLISEWGWRFQPDANFYLAPTRAWELLAGSMCAFGLSNRSQPQNSILSFLGLILIIYAILFYDKTIPFPSIYAIIPVLGTVLIIIFAGDKTVTGRILGVRQFVGIGLISYSAYLWHQPLFAFARVSSSTEPSTQLMLALVALSLSLAYLSWRFIEKPFRKKGGTALKTRRKVFAASAVGSACVMSLGLFGYFSEGNPTGKFDDRTILIIAKAEKSNYTWDNKLIYDSLQFPKNDKKNILVIGDSNSGDLLNALIYAYGHKYNYSSITIEAGCGNLFIDRVKFEKAKDAKRLSQCRFSNTYSYSKFLIRKADHVFLASSWRTFEAAHFSDSWSNLNREFGAKFFVLGAKNIDFSKDVIFRNSYDKINEISFRPNPESLKNNNKIKSVAKSRYIDPYEIMCDEFICKFIKLGEPTYYDDSHLTRSGTRIMGQWLHSWGKSNL